MAQFNRYTAIETKIVMSIVEELESLEGSVRRSQKRGRILLLVLLVTIPYFIFDMFSGLERGKQLKKYSNQIENVAAEANDPTVVAETLIKVEALSRASSFGLYVWTWSLVCILVLFVCELAVIIYLKPSKETELLLKLARAHIDQDSASNDAV